MPQLLFLDVMVGPMIALFVGAYVVLPALLIGLVVFLTIKLIKKLN